MAQQIRLRALGGPEVLHWEEVELAAPGPGEALVRHTAVGLNFIDTYHRTGLYPLDLPTGLGIEAAGVVEAIGPDVGHVAPGDRVVYGGGPPCAYSDRRLIPAEQLVVVPDGISDEQAAAGFIKGLTVQYLLRQTYPLKAGETVLIHAAAGGVGLLACQWAAHLGATVIGTVGTDEKAELAADHGCHHPIVYTREDFVARVRELTGGAGVPVVYDSVGKATWEGSLDCLSPLGLMVSFGNASGPVPPIEPGVLALKGSLFLTRPTLFSYAATRAQLEAMAAELFGVVRSGAVKIPVNQRFALKDVADAHRALEARETTGSTVLLP
jgi:NADPH2:quinone reductase